MCSHRFHRLPALPDSEGSTEVPGSRKSSMMQARQDPLPTGTPDRDIPSGVKVSAEGEDVFDLFAVSDATVFDESSDAYIDPKKIILPAAFADNGAGKIVKIEHDRLFVDGEDRNHIAWNGLEHSDCEGEITHVDPKVTGQVVLEGGSFENPIRGFAQVCVHRPFVHVLLRVVSCALMHTRVQMCVCVWHACAIGCYMMSMPCASTFREPLCFCRGALGLSARHTTEYTTTKSRPWLSRWGSTSIKMRSRRRCRS